VEHLGDGTRRPGEPDSLGERDEPVGFACQAGPWLAWAQKEHVHVSKDGKESTRLAAAAPWSHVAMSPDGRWLAASQLLPFQAHLWETTTWKEVLRLPAAGNVRLGFSPDNACLVVGTSEAYEFVDLRTLQPRGHLPRLHTSTGPGYLAFSPDGRLLAVARTRAQIALYEFPALRELATFEAPRAPAIFYLTFDTSGRYLAMASTVHQVHLWDLHRVRKELGRLGLDW
jgi:uncharacterized protein with WD repeat